MKPFNRFPDLFSIYLENIKLSKKFHTQLEKEAIDWYKENFGGHFSLIKSTSHRWYFSCGSLTFEPKGLGAYTFRFIIQMAHYEFWKVPQFKEGFKHGRNLCKKEIGRDDNPYSKQNFFYNSAWDAGYICGLYNYKFFPHTKK